MQISVLSPDVIAKIAAGEVVDRPASVVKELLENSIDAGATIIEIHVKDAGKELIHIKDNGSGISKPDLENLFTRHATSKIQNINDLETIHSMGFRGEALYSIAAVSDITLRTQTAGSKDAWSIHVQGGKRLDLAPTATSGPGTNIKITELFFNTPARRKFLKSNASEINQIIGVVIPYTLIYPEKQFLLSHAGRDLIALTPASGRLDRAAAALNLEQKDLLEVAQNYPEENLSIKMVLGNINVQRPRRDTQFIFINDRPVMSKYLGFTLNDIYRALLPPGVYPAFVLDIQIDPADVDVNIHPAKREVRIKNEAKICSIVRHLSEDALMRFGNAKAAQLPAGFVPTGNYERAYTLPPRNDPQSAGLFPSSTIEELSDLFNGTDNSLQTKFSQAKFIGSFINKYLLFEQGASLLMVDQHAAQERIMFEKFQKQIEQGAVETQPLLVPVLVRMNAQERVAWDDIKDKMQEVGIEATLFDEETLAVHAQPILLKNIVLVMRALLSGADIARCDRVTIARRACKASIVTGDRLSPQQADYQRQQLLECQSPFTCPHGRPTVVELTEPFLDRQFLR